MLELANVPQGLSAERRAELEQSGYKCITSYTISNVDYLGQRWDIRHDGIGFRHLRLVLQRASEAAQNPSYFSPFQPILISYHIISVMPSLGRWQAIHDRIGLDWFPQPAPLLLMELIAFPSSSSTGDPRMVSLYFSEMYKMKLRYPLFK